MRNYKTFQKINWTLIGKIAAGVIGLFFGLWYIGGAIVLHDQYFASQVALLPNAYNDVYEVNLPGITKEPLEITASNGEKLDAWLFTKPDATQLTIVNHGNAGNLTSRGFIAQILTQADSNVLLYDYRGFGKSKGQATLHGIVEDGLRVFTYARNKLGYPADKIVEYGESIGTAVACEVAAQNKCQALILYAPLDSLPNAGKHTMPYLKIYPDFCFAEQFNNVALIRTIQIPLLVCHGLKDETLRPEGAQRIYDAASEPKTLLFLPGTSHFEMPPLDRDIFQKGISQFYSSL